MAPYLSTLALLLLGSSVVHAAKQPNFVFVLTDDQDKHMESVEHMQHLQTLIQNKGTTFPRHYCTVAVCCPSRANLWTGRAAHNTNVTDITPPYGGYDKVVTEGINDSYLPVWLQDAGYNTYYAGKIWNHHTAQNYQNPRVKGFTGSELSVDPTTYMYYKSDFTRDGKKKKNYDGQYSPDVVASKISAFLDDAIDDVDNHPFFVVAAPVAPHAELTGDHTSVTRAPPWAPRFDGMFSDYQIPRTDNFNPASDPTGAGWMKDLPRLDDDTVASNDQFQIARIRALQSVDEMIEDLAGKIDKAGLWNNTYFIFSTDNGFHISQHRTLPGKMCSIEEDINIPFIVRGPGVEEGAVANGVVSTHTDFAPTIFKLAGIDLRGEFDGAPIPLTADEIQNTQQVEHVNAEYWGAAHPAGLITYPPDQVSEEALNNNTYKAIRVIGENDEYNLYYSVWCTNEHEMYDMTKDEGQLNNLFNVASVANDFSLYGRSFKVVADRLDGLMMVLKSCKADTCRRPWAVLHPNNPEVTSLKDALDAKYDNVYKTVPKVRYNRCAPGYLLSAEGPQLTRRDLFAYWPEWT